ncbi:hypothetical protein F1880_000158 [Penicillium rolfsii]|nr:hypothetical protein F1880_000158 [Penicillium rolfsii]
MTLVDPAVQSLKVTVKVNLAAIQGTNAAFVRGTWSSPISLVHSFPAVMEPSRVVADKDEPCTGPIVVTLSRSQGLRRVQPWRPGIMETAIDVEGWPSRLYVENGDGSRKYASADEAGTLLDDH